MGRILSDSFSILGGPLAEQCCPQLASQAKHVEAEEKVLIA